MPPITMVFILTGLAVFTQAMFFLGIGASAEEGKKSPIIPVGYISVLAGIVNLVVGVYITGFYGLFFIALGLAEILGLDLRVIGNLAIPTAILPLFWINFFSGSTTFTLILIWWTIAFLSITLTTYGKLQARALGVILMLTAVFTFFLVPVFFVMGWNLP